MLYYFNLNKKGFSLLELSIVLIIVGLIIVSIVGAKSLVNNTKINVLISEIQTITTAMNNCKNDYDNYSATLANLVDKGYLEKNKNFSYNESDLNLRTMKTFKSYPSKISKFGIFCFSPLDQIICMIVDKINMETGTDTGIMTKSLCKKLANKLLTTQLSDLYLVEQIVCFKDGNNNKYALSFFIDIASAKDVPILFD